MNGILTWKRLRQVFFEPICSEISHGTSPLSGNYVQLLEIPKNVFWILDAFLSNVVAYRRTFFGFKGVGKGLYSNFS